MTGYPCTVPYLENRGLTFRCLPCSLQVIGVEEDGRQDGGKDAVKELKRKVGAILVQV